MANNGIDILTYAASKAYTDKVAGGGGGSSINVVQTIGSSTTDVMSQDATSKLVFNGGSYPIAIRIGNENETNNMSTISIGAFNEVGGNGSVSIGANASAKSSIAPIAIGAGAGASANYTVAIGKDTIAAATNAVSIGTNASTQGFSNSVALGSHAFATRQGEVSVGCSSSFPEGYNNTPYRVIGGVHDGQLDHDAVTVAQINALIDAINTATGASIAHIGA